MYSEQVKPSTFDKLVIDCVNDHEEMKSTRIGIFEEMIKTNMIDVNEALSFVVKEMKNISDMGMVVICLRNGADRNLYIDANALGPAHILVYAQHTLPKSLFEMFYIIMVMSGSDVSRDAYKRVIVEDPMIFYTKKNDYSVPLIKVESVHDWLKKIKDFKLPAYTSDLIELVKTKNDRHIYGVYLNTVQFGKWDIECVSYMLYSRNSNWQNVEITFSSKEEKIKQGSVYLKIAINATFYDLVVAQLNVGYRPTYIDFSFWIQHYKTIKHVHNVDYLIDQLESSFIELIKRGYKIDLYYLDEIGSINPDFRRTLYDEYEKPLYDKVCSITNDGYIPDEIKNVSVYLGIPEGVTKASFCSSIESITKADHDSLIKANRKRSTDAISNKLNLLSDYINNNHFNGCTNISSFENDPLTYPVDLLSYYKDSDNHTWCFLSNDFESLLRNKINPSTKERLPDDFLVKLKQQTDMLEYFGIPLTDPKTINKIIAEIKSIDTPTNKESDVIINRVQLLLESKGYTKAFIIKEMKLRDLVNKFKRIDVNIDEILILSESEYDKTIENARTEFSPQVMYNLICFALNDVLTYNIEQLKNFLK